MVYSQMEKVGNYNKQYYDSKIKTVDIEVGDHVLVRNIDKDPGGKIKSHWEQRIWLVTAKEDNIPVYTIKLLNGSRVKKVHRNLLMKVNNLPLETFGQQPKPPRRPQSPAPNAGSGDSVPHTQILSSRTNLFCHEVLIWMMALLLKIQIMWMLLILIQSL